MYQIFYACQEKNMIHRIVLDIRLQDHFYSKNVYSLESIRRWKVQECQNQPQYLAVLNKFWRQCTVIFQSVPFIPSDTIKIRLFKFYLITLFNVSST